MLCDRKSITKCPALDAERKLLYNAVKRLCSSQDGFPLSRNHRAKHRRRVRLASYTAALLYFRRIPKYVVRTIEATARSALNSSTFVIRHPPLPAFVERSSHRASPLDHSCIIPHRPAARQGGFPEPKRRTLSSTFSGKKRPFVIPSFQSARLPRAHGVTVALMPMRTFSMSRRETVTS